METTSPSISPTPPLSTFPNFPRLPTELRFQIWNTVLDRSPRGLVTLHTSTYRQEPYLMRSPLPSLFYTNRESRSEAVRRYTSLDSCMGAIYVSYEHDRLLLRHHVALLGRLMQTHPLVRGFRLPSFREVVLEQAFPMIYADFQLLRRGFDGLRVVVHVVRVGEHELKEGREVVVESWHAVGSPCAACYQVPRYKIVYG